MKRGTEWFALYLRRQHEKAMARALASKGFETLLPLCGKPVDGGTEDKTFLAAIPYMEAVA
jgi:hypothetical protein